MVKVEAKADVKLCLVVGMQGCDHCQCDVGGTEIQNGEIAVCDKANGQCRCRSGITGRRCG
jgi:hypothetical protein